MAKFLAKNEYFEALARMVRAKLSKPFRIKAPGSGGEAGENGRGEKAEGEEERKKRKKGAKKKKKMKKKDDEKAGWAA